MSYDRTTSARPSSGQQRYINDSYEESEEESRGQVE